MHKRAVCLPCLLTSYSRRSIDSNLEASILFFACKLSFVKLSAFMSYSLSVWKMRLVLLNERSAHYLLDIDYIHPYNNLCLEVKLKHKDRTDLLRITLKINY